MVTFDKSDLQRFTVSALGALLLSAACIVSAVGPDRSGNDPASKTAVTGLNYTA